MWYDDEVKCTAQCWACGKVSVISSLCEGKDALLFNHRENILTVRSAERVSVKE